MNEIARLGFGVFFSENATADFFHLHFYMRENRAILSGSLLVVASFN